MRPIITDEDRARRMRVFEEQDNQTLQRIAKSRGRIMAKWVGDRMGYDCDYNVWDYGEPNTN